MPTSISTTIALTSQHRSRRPKPSYGSRSKTPPPRAGARRRHRRFANNLLNVWPALWTFTTTDGIEPTNNPAERAPRGPVIDRKVSLGTHSTSGERFAERAHSAAATCRMQRRSLFTYLSKLIASHNRGDPFPALTWSFAGRTYIGTLIERALCERPLVSARVSHFDQLTDCGFGRVGEPREQFVVDRVLGRWRI